MAARPYLVKDPQDKSNDDLAQLKSKQLWSTHPFYTNSEVGKILTAKPASSATANTSSGTDTKIANTDPTKSVPFGSSAHLLKAKFDPEGRKIEVDDRDRDHESDREFGDPGEYDRLRRDGGWDGKGRTWDEMVTMGEVRRMKG